MDDEWRHAWVEVSGLKRRQPTAWKAPSTLVELKEARQARRTEQVFDLSSWQLQIMLEKFMIQMDFVEKCELLEELEEKIGSSKRKLDRRRKVNHSENVSSYNVCLSRVCTFFRLQTFFSR
jgi:hypothetical protein